MTGFATVRAARVATTALAVLVVVASSLGPAFAQMGGGMGNGHGNGMPGTTGNMGKGMGGAMLVSGQRPYRADGTTLRIEDATAVAQQYLTALGVSGLALDEVEEWDFNFYVVVKETAPPQYKAFELLVDKWSGSVMPEPGPNMMWNEKYGMRHGAGRHMVPKVATLPMTVTPEAAAAAATAFLRERFPSRPNAVVAEADTFYGYYTFDVMDGGTKIGMLGVNGTTSQVWYHTWHGAFIQGREIE